jgi:hypothetical protein
VEYLGYSDGLDFAVSGDSIFIWARGAWRKFCAILDWVSRWPAKGIKKMLWHGVWIGLKSRDALLV